MTARRIQDPCQLVSCTRIGSEKSAGSHRSACLQSTRVLHLGIHCLIFSRPEHHLKRIFETATSEGFCCTKEVLIDDLKTQTDIQLYLRTEFIRSEIPILLCLKQRKPGQEREILRRSSTLPQVFSFTQP